MYAHGGLVGVRDMIETAELKMGISLVVFVSYDENHI